MNARASGREPAVGFIFVTMVLAVLGFGLLIPVLPGLVTQFQGGDVSVGSHTYGILVGVFALLQFVGSPILGALSDRFGRRKVILLSLAGASVDYVIMANAPDLTWLFIGRMISGFTAGVLATANAYVADVTPPEKRAHNFGLLGAAFGIGFIIGPLIGGLLGSVSLRLPFWFAAVCAAINWLYGFFVLPESLAPENRKPFDWRKANPLGALKALGRFPAVRNLADAYFLVMISQAMVFTTWVLYTGYRYHWSAGQVGATLCLAGVVSAVVQAFLVKKVVARLGVNRSIVLGLCSSVASLTLYGLATEGWMIFVIIFAGALGNVTGPALQAYVTTRVPPTEQGSVQGIFAGLSSLSAIPGTLIGTWSFSWGIAPGSAWHLPGISFFEAALMVVFSLLLVLRVFAREAKAGAPQT